MECWSAQNHLKNCKKCALQARQEGIKEAIKIMKEWRGGYIKADVGKEMFKELISELKKKERIK